MLSIGKVLEVPRDAGVDWDGPFQRLARALGVCVFASGTIALIAGVLPSALLTSMNTMKANTALGFVFVGALLITPTSAQQAHHQFNLRTLLAVLIFLVGASTAVEYALAVDLGIDQLVVTYSGPADNAYPGRMSVLSAVSFGLLGAAFLIMDSEDSRLRMLARSFALLVFAIGYAGIIGYVFDAQGLYRARFGSALSIQGAMMFLMTSAALLFLRPTRGLMRVLSQDDVRGMLLRRLLPTVLFMAPAVAWLQTKATGPANAVVVALGDVALLVMLVWWSAKTINTAIAQRDVAEATSKASEERLHWALEAAGGGAWDWDLTRDEAWWSEEMFTLWRIEPNTTIRFANSLEAIDPRDREAVAAAIQKAIRERAMYRLEFRITDANGDERWIESRGRASYDAVGKAVRLLGITIDVTAQKKVELSLRRSNLALEQSNTELQRLAYVASHDLQTPLRTVSSFAELLHARYAATFPPEANGWLARIRSSVDKLQSLVGDLLQYSRAETEAQHFTAVSMDEMLSRAVQLLETPIQETGATIEHSSLPTVTGDATQLAGVMLSLVGNALKYRSAEPPHIVVHADLLDGEWKFYVADNGIGIEARHYDRIFEMFERLHGAAEYPGTGIGLAICRRVIQRHGGRIWVESHPGQGSKFCFTLPLAKSEPSM
jgi:signal transduction histidine kinase